MSKIILFFAIIVGLTSCATIISGTSQSINFSSNPSRATISDNGVHLGHTPLSVDLKRKKNHSIRIELEGYEAQEFVLERKFNAWYLGNILFGGIIGLIIDPITGAMYNLTPNQIAAEFNNGTAFKQENNNIYVAVSLTKNSEWEQIGVLKKK